MTIHTYAEDQHPHDMTLNVCHSQEHKIQPDSKVT